jgi:hypothetical protein
MLRPLVDVFQPRELEYLVLGELAPFDTEAVVVFSDDLTVEIFPAGVPISPAPKLNPNTREQRDR